MGWTDALGLALHIQSILVTPSRSVLEVTVIPAIKGPLLLGVRFLKASGPFPSTNQHVTLVYVCSC